MVSPTPGSGGDVNFNSPDRAGDDFIGDYHREIDRLFALSGASTFGDFNLDDPLNVPPSGGSMSLSVYISLFNLVLQISTVQDWLLSREESLKRAEFSAAQADFVTDLFDNIKGFEADNSSERNAVLNAFKVFQEVINMFRNYRDASATSDEEAGTVTKATENRLETERGLSTEAVEAADPDGFGASRDLITGREVTPRDLDTFEQVLENDQRGSFEIQLLLSQLLIDQAVNTAGASGGVSAPLFLNNQGIAGDLISEDVDGIVSTAVAANLLVNVDLANVLGQVEDISEVLSEEELAQLLLLLTDTRSFIAFIEALLLAFAAALAALAEGTDPDEEDEIRNAQIAAERAEIARRDVQLREDVEEAALDAVRETARREEEVLQEDIRRSELRTRLLQSLIALEESLPAALAIIEAELDRLNITSPNLGVLGQETTELQDGLRALFLKNDEFTPDQLLNLLNQIVNISSLTANERRGLFIATDLLALGLEVRTVTPEDVINLLIDEGLIGEAQTPIEAFNDVVANDPRREVYERALLADVRDIIAREVRLDEIDALARENSEVNLAVIQFTLLPLIVENRRREVRPVLESLANLDQEAAAEVEALFRRRADELGLTTEQANRILQLAADGLNEDEVLGLGRTILNGLLDEENPENEIRGSTRI